MPINELSKIAFKPGGLFRVTAVKHTLRTGIEEHFHESVEIVFIAKGSGTQLVCGQGHSISPGDVFVINPGASHGFSKVDGLVLYNVSYMHGLLSMLGSELAQLPGYQSLFVIGAAQEGAPFRCKLRLSLDDLAWAVGLVESMIRELASGSPGSEPLVRAYFMELVVGLARRYEQGSPSGRSEGLELAAKAASHLERHFLEELSLESLARSLSVSGRHLRRVFSKHCRISPMEYLMRLRVRHAASLLEGSELRVSEIAFRSGFGDSNYFARQFRRVAGVSPRQYRSRLR